MFCEGYRYGSQALAPVYVVSLLARVSNLRGLLQCDKGFVSIAHVEENVCSCLKVKRAIHKLIGSLAR